MAFKSPGPMITAGFSVTTSRPSADEFGGDFFGFELGIGVPEAFGRQVEAVGLVSELLAGPDADGGGAAGEDDAAHAGRLGGCKYMARAFNVDAPERVAVVVLPVVGFGGDMKDQLAAGAGVFQAGDIIQIAVDGFHGQIGQLAQLLIRAIERAHGVPILPELPRDMRADEAGRAGDQSFHALILPYPGASHNMRRCDAGAATARQSNWRPAGRAYDLRRAACCGPSAYSAIKPNCVARTTASVRLCASSLLMMALT